MTKKQSRSKQEANSSGQKTNYHSRIDSSASDNYIFDDGDEISHFECVCEAYRQYSNFAICQWTSHEYRLKMLSGSQQKILPEGLQHGTPAYCKRFKNFRDAVVRNQFCLDCILRHVGQPHSQQDQTRKVNVTDDQISKVASVLKSLTRDWSIYGRHERKSAYDPIKRLVKKYLPLESDSVAAQQPTTILVPGSGVGRLAFELAGMGYSVQGNEFSMYMLLASDFMLNNGGRICNPERPLHLSPWLLESRNVHESTDQFCTAQIPDVDPITILTPPSDDLERISSKRSPEFSMAAGDFSVIYNDEDEKWDCVTSCFFLDACPNIVEIIQVIYKILKPGGLFVNLGPLLYHWSGPPMRPDDKSVEEYRQRYVDLDSRYFTSINLSYNDIREILNNIGFDMLEEERGIECYYTSDRRSMMSTKYSCVSFVAQKRKIIEDSQRNKH
mmetsp:Transcript_9940/g.24184  ORF Transcript_9940/g.24184 Transcript_9940/m.24184 type:complete len:443 (-) Transcript_9940:159-1487(-)